MPPRFFSSPFKNALATPAKKESWWSEIPVADGLPSEGCDGIKATAGYWLALGSSSGSLVMLPYDQYGKFGMKAPTLQTGLRAITAFEVDGFDRLLAVGGTGGQINVFELPPLSALDLSSPSAQTPAPLLSVAASSASVPVDCIAFHPLADSIFLSTSHTSLAIWDASSRSTSPVFQLSMPAQAWSAQWSVDGKHVTTTGKDGKLRMWNVRSGSSDPVAEVVIHAGPKATRHVHIPALSPSSSPQIITTGFSRTRDREYSLLDIRSLASGPTKTQRIDTGTAIITPLVDESRGIVYLTGKGDMTLRWVEVGGPGGPTEGSAALPVPLLSAALAPPNTLELMKAEINRLVILAGGGNDAAVPVSITVPRRQYLDFHADLYPPVSARVPAQCGQDWLSRKDEAMLHLEKRHLDPSRPWAVGEKTRTSAASPAFPAAQDASPPPTASPAPPAAPAEKAQSMEEPAAPPIPRIATTPAALAPAAPSTFTPASTNATSISSQNAPVSTPSEPIPSAAVPTAALSTLSLNGKASSPPPTFGSPAARTSSTPVATTLTPTVLKDTTTTAAAQPTRSSAKLGDSMRADAWSRKFLAGKTPLKPDYFDVHDLSSTMGNDVQLLKASSLYFFYPLAGPGGRLAFHPLARKGRLPVHPSCVSIGGTITDFAVDPFDPNRVFVAGDDSAIRVFSLSPDPAEEWTEGEVLAEPTKTLTDARMDRISELHHHPTAKDVLLSISNDKGSPAARLWDVGTGEMLLRAELPKGGVSSTAWSPDGSLLAIATKNKQVHVLDPRSASSLVSTAGHDSIRPVRLAWASDIHLISTGFNRAASRELILYQLEDHKLVQVGKASLDISPAPLFPYCDIDTRIALLYSRGDRSCHAYEVSLHPATPHEAFAKLPHFEHATLQSGFAFFPKTSNDIKAVEIVRALRLTPSTVEAISFTVPRAKVEYFQDDIFVPTRNVTKPSMTAEEYLSGANKPLEIVNLRPEGMKLLSDAPAPVKTVSTRSKIKSDGLTDLQREQQHLDHLFQTAKDEAASDEEEAEPVRSKNAIAQDDDEW